MAENDFKIEIEVNPKLGPDGKRFIEQLKKDLQVGLGNLNIEGTKTKKGAKAGGKGGIGGDLLSGVLGKVGLAAGALGVIAMLLDHFKPIVKMVQAIASILMEFLRPIADMVMMLLIPILQIIRPILIVFRAIMAPFRKAAFQLIAAGGQKMKAGDTGGAMSAYALAFETMFAGIFTVVLKLFAENIKMIIDVINTVAKTIVSVFLQTIAYVVSIFSDSGADKILEFRDYVLKQMDAGAKVLKDFIDFSVAVIAVHMADGITKQAKEIGVDIDSFSKDVRDMVGNVIMGKDNSFIKAFEDQFGALGDAFPKMVDDAFDPLIQKIKEKLDAINSMGGGGGIPQNSVTKLSPYQSIDYKYFNGYLPGGVSPNARSNTITLGVSKK